MKRNGYQEFEERENLKRARYLNLNLIESIRKKEQEMGRNYEEIAKRQQNNREESGEER